MLKLIYFLLHLIFSFQSKPNLFLGAGGVAFGCGSNSPAVQRPYSYVRLGPDTTPLIKKDYIAAHHFGGYSTMDHAIRAVSHMHLVGAGVQDLGILGVLPTVKQKISLPPQDTWAILYKNTQEAQPGYYNSIIEHNITVQLTTTQRAGVHRYIFPKNVKKRKQLYIMSSYLLQKKASRNSSTFLIRDCLKQFQNNKCIQGKIYINGGFGSRFGGYYVYYHMQWRQQQSNSGQTTKVYLFDDKEILQTLQQVHGNFTGAVLIQNSSKIQLYVGLSYVSIDNARENLHEEVKGRNFDSIRQQSLNFWEQQLNRFEITAISEDFQTKIDTAIYRTLLSPTLFNDYNRQYPSFSLDGSVATVPEDMKGVYTDMSLWDVHRTQFPWLQFQDPQRFNDIAKSLILINRDGGYMPKWPFANGHTGCMIGAHANTILADWLLKQGYRDTNVNASEIFEYMLRNANTQTKYDTRSNPQKYIKSGYMTIEQRGKTAACSQTLELSYNDFTISQVAKHLNQSQLQKEFLRRSKFYQNVWNPQTKFFQSRYENGSFIPINPIQRLSFFSNLYTEGNAWHYRFYAPHDVQGLVELFGNQNVFILELDKFFRRSFLWPTLWLPNLYYWAGNEHNLFSVWLFNFVNRSDLTQKYSRKILQTQYGLDGSGLPGNDDYGTMSAWLIFASLGFYPLPGKNLFVLGSPVIHQARILRKKPNNKLIPFNINVEHNGVKKCRVQSITINEKSLENFVQFQNLDQSNVRLNFRFQ